MKDNYEQIVMELVVNGGNARSLAMEAIQAAQRREYHTASDKIRLCNEALNKAHEVQTELLQAEASGTGTVQIGLIMVHGQDHLMNAITVRDLAIQMIEMYKIIYREEGMV